jgi:histidinol-phosphate aminotransferase
MKEYYPPLGSRDGLRLDFNENTLACSPAVREVLSRISAGDLTRYPERESVEAIVATHLGLAPQQVALTNGVDEAIHVLFETFLEEGDELLLPVPTYTMYEVYASATDARVITVQADDDLQFPFQKLLGAISARTKIIAIANPNSPSGSPAAREQILELARRAPYAVILVDEAYFHFCGETVMDLAGATPNLIVARTFSKAYGLAGLRIGVLAGPVETMKWVRRVLSPYSVNSVALACLPVALADAAYLDWYVNEVLAAREEFESALVASRVRFWPSRANFILVDIGPRHREFVRHMADAGVLVRDRSNDPGCDGRVRITIGTREQMRQAVVAMNKTLAATGGGSGMKSRKISSPPTPEPKTRKAGADSRMVTFDRNTTETRISIMLKIEGQGRYQVATGIRFFDHMLELFTRHGAFDLELKCDGDLDVDQHHTVEDVGIALGEAFDRALGDKRGILRAGYFLMPMDETLAIAAVDLSGRAAFAVDTKVRARLVGDLQTELVTDFFEGFARGARANVHVKTMFGRSNHHKIEAIFKAFARALRVACSRDKQLGQMLPSTKGLL